ncbi:uncharacterized protein LOC123291045 [Chrysoperla carnea]|uniref:uncharacterized protein LOC123291045 n=1 Tax=Chrysoperla carnea TaxID=189513 RepID=UPI001D08537D|nr:uncharacterized protein LOC123291045 [Chrysoperla carnea]
MIRFCFNIMLATFAKPWFALNAVGVRSINVCGITLTICVRDPNWHLVGFKEVDFCHETNNRIKQSQQSILLGATSTTIATSRNVKQSKYQSVASMVSTASRKLLMSSLLPSKSSKTTGSTRFQRQRLPPPQRPNTNVIL